MAEDAFLVSVVVVNLNGRRFLDGLMETLHAQDYETIEIILVDNNSSDNTGSWVSSAFPNVKYHYLQTSVPFSKAINVGFDKSDGEYFITLKLIC